MSLRILIVGGACLGAACFGGAFQASAASVTSETQADNGTNSATIVQTGPSEGKPTVRIRKGPGYQSIEQHSKRNSATIIQQDSGGTNE